MTERLLVVTADDLGASPGINRGIAEAHTNGVLTSASLMVTGAAVEDAVALSRHLPDLAVGLHWDVVGEDEREFDTHDWDAVRAEFAEQLARFRELMGRDPTHIDSHRHQHRRPELRPVFRELVAPLGVPLRDDGRVHFVGDFYAQWEWGVTDLDKISVEAFTGLLRTRVHPGWTEISTHPGYRSREYEAMYDAEREHEVRTLTDPRVREEIERLGITLTSYAGWPR